MAERAALSAPTIRHLERGYGNLTSWRAALDALKLELVARQLPPAESTSAAK